jgi:hypothetical protein
LPEGTFKFKPHKEGEEKGYDYNPGWSALELAQCSYDHNVKMLERAYKSFSEEVMNDLVVGTTENAVKEAYLWRISYWEWEVKEAESEMGKAMTLAA